MPQKSGSKSMKGSAACAKGELHAESPIPPAVILNDCTVKTSMSSLRLPKELTTV